MCAALRNALPTLLYSSFVRIAGNRGRRLATNKHAGVRVLISLQELQLHSVKFNVDIPAGEIEYDGRSKQVSALHAEGEAKLISNTLGEIRIHGRLNVDMEAPCDRCLETAHHSMDKTFDLLYCPSEQLEGGGEEEINEGDSEVAYYHGNRLDLSDILREVVLLAMPMQLVCSASCKGICPSCGQNRNLQECGCRAAAVDDRWSKLRTLRSEINSRN